MGGGGGELLPWRGRLVGWGQGWLGGEREGVMVGGSSVFPMLRVSGVSELDTGRCATGRFFPHFIVWRWT